jgi:hypothetical protein
MIKDFEKLLELGINNLKFSLLLIILTTLHNLNSAFCQDFKFSTGQCQSVIYENETVNQGKDRIKKLAITNALERAYGQVYFKGNTMYSKTNEIDGEIIESQRLFNSYGENYVKGELIEVLSEKFTQLTYEINKDKKGNKKRKKVSELGMEWKCEVVIKCREYQAPAAQFTSYTLNCPDTNNCVTTSFRNDESFFLFFSSPKKGFVTVFLDDNSSSSILLPYHTNRQNYISGFPVEAFKSYVFFENNKSYLDDAKTTIDELKWVTRENMEKLSVVFSPNPFEIPELNQSLIKYVSSQYNLPDNLPSEDFNKWLITLQSKRKDIEIMRIYLNTVDR